MIPKEQCTKATSLIIRSMDQGCKYFRMEISMKASGVMIKPKDAVSLYTLTVIFMKVNGKIVRLMVMGSMCTMMELNT